MVIPNATKPVSKRVATYGEYAHKFPSYCIQAGSRIFAHDFMVFFSKNYRDSCCLPAVLTLTFFAVLPRILRRDLRVIT